MKLFVAAAAAVTLLSSGAAVAACPPLSVYHVQGITAPSSTLQAVAPRLFAGTAWKATTTGPAASVPLHLNNVGGPLNKVLAAVVSAANSDRYAVTSMTDDATCTVTLTVATITPRPAPQPKDKTLTLPAHTAVAAAVAPVSMPTGTVSTYGTHGGTHSFAATASDPPRPVAPAYTLPKGELVSTALARYVSTKGWHLQWEVPNTYVLSEPLPIPAGKTVIEGVTYVLHTYQFAGVMLNDVPLFSTANHVAAILPASALNQAQRREAARSADEGEQP